MTRFEPKPRFPGPAALPPTVRETSGRQMVKHRGDGLKALFELVESGMKPFFGTTPDVILLTCVAPGSAVAAAQQGRQARHTPETLA